MDEDTHLCLNCHITVVGLDNYVHHRKNECVVSATNSLHMKDTSFDVQDSGTITKENGVSSKAVCSDLVNVTCIESAIPPVAPKLSAQPSQQQDVELYNSEKSQPQSDENVNDLKKSESSIHNFLSSLDLQARESTYDKQTTKCNDPTTEERLKIATILNDIDFSSDSDGLPSDVDELLDYANEEEEDTRTYKRHPRGGKWGPSGKQASSGKLAAAQSRGKLKAAQSPGKGGKYAGKTFGGKGNIIRSHKHHNQGKGKSYAKVIRNNDESDEEDDEKKEPEKTEEKKKCVPCNKEFSCLNSYERHLKSEYHSKRSNVKKSKPIKVKPQIECPVCEKMFNNKYNFARHLASSYHRKRETGVEPMILDETLQILLLRQSPLQCLVCSFYCTEMDVMMQHIESADHNENCDNLTGPLSCVRCKFKTHSNQMLIEHFNSDKHREFTKKSYSPCIIKEVRSDVKCKICDRNFHSGSQLEQHSKIYHGENPPSRPPKQKAVRYKMPCPFCNKVWNSTFQLNIHIRRRHTKEKPYPCNTCGVAFTDVNALKAHEATKKHINQQIIMGLLPSPDDGQVDQKSAELLRSSSKNICKYCDYLGTSYSDIKTHCKVEHPDQMYDCKDCSYETHIPEAFQKHIQTETHLKRFKKTTTEGQFECTDCGQCFSRKQACDIHKIKHSTIISETQLKNLHDGEKYVGLDERFHAYWERMKSTKQRHERVKCIECDKELVLSNLLNHLRKHSNSFLFECPQCESKFPSSSSLRRHIHNIHLDIKLHECQYCWKRFQRRSYLLRHIMKDHKEIATVDCPFACEFCDKSFPLKHMLTTHRISHQTERPFVCSFEGCKNCYKTKAELNIHERTHTGERPFVCEFCGYSATSKHKLTRHHKTHTQERNYSCQYCSYKAQNSTHLHRHMRIHIGTKPYKCPYCSYACNTHENVRKHILKTKRHRGLPCYPCSLCNFGTNLVKDFGEHMIEAHNQKIDSGEILSVVAGLFVKDEDMKDVPEGGRVIPVREKTAKLNKIDKIQSKQIQSEEIENTIELGNHMDIVEVDTSTILELNRTGDVQWVNQDGSIVMCTNQQFYDKLNADVLENTEANNNPSTTSNRTDTIIDPQALEIISASSGSLPTTNNTALLESSIMEVVVGEDIFESKVMDPLVEPHLVNGQAPIVQVVNDYSVQMETQ